MASGLKSPRQPRPPGQDLPFYSTGENLPVKRLHAALVLRRSGQDLLP